MPFGALKKMGMSGKFPSLKSLKSSFSSTSKTDLGDVTLNLSARDAHAGPIAPARGSTTTSSKEGGRDRQAALEAAARSGSSRALTKLARMRGSKSTAEAAPSVKAGVASEQIPIHGGEREGHDGGELEPPQQEQIVALEQAKHVDAAPPAEVAATAAASKNDPGGVLHLQADAEHLFHDSVNVVQRAQLETATRGRATRLLPAVYRRLTTLDDQLVTVLGRGDIRLLCCVWLRSQPADFRLPTRQELERTSARAEGRHC